MGINIYGLVGVCLCDICSSAILFTTDELRSKTFYIVFLTASVVGIKFC